MIGDIKMFAFQWEHEEWVPCDGRLHDMNRYPKLFSVVKTRFGGDGQTYVTVPDIPAQETQGSISNNAILNLPEIKLPETKLPVPVFKKAVDAHILFMEDGSQGITLFAGSKVPTTLGFQACDGQGGRLKIDPIHLAYKLDYKQLPIKKEEPKPEPITIPEPVAGKIFFYIQVKE